MKKIGNESISRHMYICREHRGVCWHTEARCLSSPMFDGKMHVSLYSSWIHIPRSYCVGIADCDTDLPWESRDDGSLMVGARRNSTSDAIVLSVSHTCGAPLLHFLWFSVERESRVRTRIAKLCRDRRIIIGKVYIRAVRACEKEREKKIAISLKNDAWNCNGDNFCVREVLTYNGSD